MVSVRGSSTIHGLPSTVIHAIPHSIADDRSCRSYRHHTYRPMSPSFLCFGLLTILSLLIWSFALFLECLIHFSFEGFYWFKQGTVTLNVWIYDGYHCDLANVYLLETSFKLLSIVILLLESVCLVDWKKHSLIFIFIFNMNFLWIITMFICWGTSFRLLSFWICLE